VFLIETEEVLFPTFHSLYVYPGNPLKRKEKISALSENVTFHENHPREVKILQKINETKNATPGSWNDPLCLSCEV